MENPLEILQKSSPFTDEVETELMQLSGMQKIMNDQHLPVSNDLQALESDSEIVGFEQADMNLLNTILTGIIVRHKEFSLMRSVGMSQKQLSAIVILGSVLITTGALKQQNKLSMMEALR